LRILNDDGDGYSLLESQDFHGEWEVLAKGTVAGADVSISAEGLGFGHDGRYSNSG
jgi:hypothetical protein